MIVKNVILDTLSHQKYFLNAALVRKTRPEIYLLLAEYGTNRSAVAYELS